MAARDQESVERMIENCHAYVVLHLCESMTLSSELSCLCDVASL